MRGIIVGCDEKAEWLLPWWWRNYSKHVSLPVAFIDFGLSKMAKAWCCERGLLIPFERDIKSIVEATKPPEHFKKLCGETFFEHRLAWFKKPFACLLTPFEETMWIDLDCLILKTIEPAFSFLDAATDIALSSEPESVQKQAKEIKLINDDEILYNSGVIVFKKDSRPIQAWVDILSDPTKTFPGDQDALSNALYINKIKPGNLPRIYNWPYIFPKPEDIVVMHFMGDRGKALIKQFAA